MARLSLFEFIPASSDIFVDHDLNVDRFVATWGRTRLLTQRVSLGQYEDLPQFSFSPIASVSRYEISLPIRGGP